MHILGGTFKGRVLSVPPGLQTRPITAAVKKSLFDVLGQRLPGATVADLYAGSGAIGLEAISRGAARSYFAERDRSAVATLRKNIAALGVGDRCIIWAGDLTGRLRGWLDETAAPLDVAFVDPPYAHARQWSWSEAQETIFDPLAGRLAAAGLVVLRLPSKVDPPPRMGPLAVERVREYGDMVLVFLGMAQGPPPTEAAAGEQGPKSDP